MDPPVASSPLHTIPFPVEEQLSALAPNPVNLGSLSRSRENSTEHLSDTLPPTTTFQIGSIDKITKARVGTDLAITKELVGDSTICGLTSKEEAILHALKAIEIDRSLPVSYFF